MNPKLYLIAVTTALALTLSLGAGANPVQDGYRAGAKQEKGDCTAYVLSVK